MIRQENGITAIQRRNSLWKDGYRLETGYKRRQLVLSGSVERRDGPGVEEDRRKMVLFSPRWGQAYMPMTPKTAMDLWGGTGRPLGSMYKNEITPDGYQTDADGAWIQ